jgi:CrcB protein
MMKYLLIAAGGALGSALRFAVQGWIHRLAGGSFPAGTLVVNVLGCLLVGLLSAMFAGPVFVRPEYRFGLLAGLLGGFTTFSTFGLETFNLTNAGQYRLAAANVLLSCGLGLAAVWGGYRLGEWWYGV